MTERAGSRTQLSRSNLWLPVVAFRRLLFGVLLEFLYSFRQSVRLGTDTNQAQRELGEALRVRYDHSDNL